MMFARFQGGQIKTQRLSVLFQGKRQQQYRSAPNSAPIEALEHRVLLSNTSLYWAPMRHVAAWAHARAGNVSASSTAAVLVATPLRVQPQVSMQYNVSVASELSEGVAANSNSGDVTIANTTVSAKSALGAAQEAGIAVTNFMSVPPSGPTSYSFSEKITTAGNTGGGTSGEASIAVAFGLSADQLIVAVEDGTDNDYNDAFAIITVTPVWGTTYTGIVIYS